MTEPTITTAIAVSAGITFFGVATGLHPELLLAGFAGGLWYQVNRDPVGIVVRLAESFCATLVAGYFAPLVGAISSAMSKGAIGHHIDKNLIELPIALVIGFLTCRVIGPTLLKMGSRHADKLTGGKNDN